MKLRSALVTGANRGLGLEFIKQLAQRQPPLQHIFAACRKPDEAQELQTLAADHSSIQIILLDVTNAADISKATETIENVVGSSGLDLLINNAGSRVYMNMVFGDLTAEVLRECFEVNTMAPVLLTQALAPSLKKAASTSKSFSMVVNMSSRLASIADNSSGGTYAYRITRTGLNMATKNMALDLKEDNVVVIAMDPGWVQTRIGGNDGAPETPPVSVKKMLDVIFSMTPKDSGTFRYYKGGQLPW